MDKVSEEFKQWKIGDLIEALSSLSPTLSLFDYAFQRQQAAEHWESKYNGAMKLAKTIIDERDEALKAARELRDKLSKLGIV